MGPPHGRPPAKDPGHLPHASRGDPVWTLLVAQLHETRHWRAGRRESGTPGSEGGRQKSTDPRGSVTRWRPTLLHVRFGRGRAETGPVDYSTRTPAPLP